MNSVLKKAALWLPFFVFFLVKTNNKLALMFEH